MNESTASELDLDALADADLLDAWHQDRRVEALRTLVERYQVMVLSVCRRGCRGESNAEDAFQMTFLYLAQNAGKIREGCRLPGWLHTVALRCAVAVQKQNQIVEAMIDPVASNADPLDRLTRIHEASIVDDELTKLPSKYRTPLVLQVLDGRSVQQIADQIGTSTGAIRGLLQRGKKILGRRLRNRGVVPVLGFAAAISSTVSTSQAAAVAQPMLNGLATSGSLSAPNIDAGGLDSLLSNTLLNNGTSSMSSYGTIAGALAGSMLLIGLLVRSVPAGDQTKTTSLVKVDVQPEAIQPDRDLNVAQIGVAPQADDGEQKKGDEESAAIQKKHETHSQVMGGGGLGGGQIPGAMTTMELRAAPSRSPTAEKARASLEQSLDIVLTCGLADLGDELAAATGVPFMIEPRGLKIAGVDPAKIQLNHSGSQPLRTALRKMLRPHALRAIVADEGIIITADMVELARKGIGVAKWIGIDPKKADEIDSALAKPVTLDLDDSTLEHAVSTLSKELNLDIAIDKRSLEEIGIAPDATATLLCKEIKAASALARMLRPLDLTYNIQDDTLTILTTEAAEGDLMTRIYWLEGTGFGTGQEFDFDSLMNTIEATIVPDTWEALGGPSTMVPSGVLKRPNMVISTTYEIHMKIESMLDSFREAQIDDLHEVEQVPVPVENLNRGFGGGGLGGFGGGVGGGFQ